MKVFIDGFHDSISMAGSLRDKINDLISSGVNIFIRDIGEGNLLIQKYLADTCYRNVQICFMRDCSEYEEWPRNNHGEWPYRIFVRQQHEYDFDPCIECELAKDVDKTVFIWDGEEIEQFARILIFLAMGKECEIHFKENEDVRKITDISELKQLIKKEEDTEITKRFQAGKNIGVTELWEMGLYLPTIEEWIRSRGKPERFFSKTEVKNMLCKLAYPLSEKEDGFLKLAKADDLYGELITKVLDWKKYSSDTKALRKAIMVTIEHSFQHAYNDIAEANRWIKKADGHDENIILYLYELYKRDGKYTELPIGMYKSIDTARDYMKWNISGAKGSRIELWEVKNNCQSGMFCEHKYNIYTLRGDIRWFEVMRKGDLVDDCDPSEPVTYVSKNHHYVPESLCI
jgi:hypothetical protein